MWKELANRISLFLGLSSSYYIGGSEALLPPLSKDEEDECLARLQNGDIEARNQLVEHNLRLVVYVAKRYENNTYNLEDLISIGTLGLFKAVSTFHADKNIKLATYASRCIENEILMYLRKRAHSKNELSLDEPLNQDHDGNELLLSDIISEDGRMINEELYTDEQKSLLRDALKDLRPREKMILSMRFGLDGKEEMTQKEVADSLGISQSYISRLEKKILKKLKNCLMSSN